MTSEYEEIFFAWFILLEDAACLAWSVWPGRRTSGGVRWWWCYSEILALRWGVGGGGN